MSKIMSCGYACTFFGFLPLIVGLTVTASGRAAVAAPNDLSSPEGYWRSIDDETGRVKSVIRIAQVGGKLQGTIERVFSPRATDEPNPRCTNCEGELKDKPLVGLRILWDLSKDGAEWSGGRIMDPKKGKTYRCAIEVIEGGKRLKVRGYVGLSLFGRTQYWERSNADETRRQPTKAESRLP